MESLSIYVHFPFCQHRCGYCDFNTYAGIEYLIPPYVGAMLKEISNFSESFENSRDYYVHSIYLGGGTPSLVPPIEIEKIINTLRRNFKVMQDCEITMEVNPGTISKESLQKIFDLGVNRLSIGVQSTNKDELELLERLHGFSEVSHTVETAKKVGFQNLSMDLIYGLPDQKTQKWMKSLDDVLNLEPEHLSLYALSVEEGTPLALSVKSGSLTEPDPDLAADLYGLSIEVLESKGYVHYEISNWASCDPFGQPKISRHNRQYWMNLPYIGFGAGAHGFIEGYRLQNVSSPFAYIKKMNESKDSKSPSTPATEMGTKIEPRREMEETMIMGLRLLTEGITLKRFKDRFGVDLRDEFQDQLERLLKLGLLRWGGEDNSSLLLTERGYLVANQVFVEFI